MGSGRKRAPYGLFKPRPACPKYVCPGSRAWHRGDRCVAERRWLRPGTRRSDAPIVGIPGRPRPGLSREAFGTRPRHMGRPEHAGKRSRAAPEVGLREAAGQNEAMKGETPLNRLRHQRSGAPAILRTLLSCEVSRRRSGGKRSGRRCGGRFFDGGVEEGLRRSSARNPAATQRWENQWRSGGRRDRHAAVVGGLEWRIRVRTKGGPHRMWERRLHPMR